MTKHYVGYARVSSVGQSLEIQLSQLSAFGCREIFKEKHTGTTANRPELKAVRKYLRKGDVLVITKLDRLARSMFHLTQIHRELMDEGADLVVLNGDMDTRTPQGKLMFNMLGSFAEFETELRKERQMEGIAKAKEKGVHFGRKAKLTDDQVEQMKQDRVDGLLIKELMKKYSLSKASVYRLMNDAAGE